MTVADLVSRARQRERQYVGDLTRIVNMDSGTHDVERVNEVGRLIAMMLADSDCSIEWHEPRSNDVGNTFVARLAGERPGRVVLLGHHDTVYASGTADERPFRVEGSRAFGPGVMDMKGGVLLGVYALRLIRELRGADHPELIFVGNPDEEIGSPNSRSVIEDAARDADLVLVLEPGREAGSIQTTRKGVGMYELVVEGVSSHAGARPEDGRSAILELAHKTIALHALTDFESGTTVNVGVVRGGSRRNVVPDRASASIDLRASTVANADRARELIHEIARRATIEGTSATISGGMNRPPMEKTKATERAIDVGRTLVSEMGLDFLETTSGGGSDGNFTAALGVPTLDGLGPVGRHAHSPEEWLDLSSFPQRLALVAGLIDRAPLRGA
ncbi:MAG TPA: M20 family metallopeptidase [Thermomicrobiales bacterium]|nr:M20 family metallopeptidase [Thermomicrobiales bacterium]